WGGIGSKSRHRGRITTPFILERANHSKGWDAKRQTLLVLWHGGCAAEGMDFWRTHRPSRDSRQPEVARSRLDPGPEQSGMPGLAPLFSPPSQLSSRRSCPDVRSDL